MSAAAVVTAATTAAATASAGSPLWYLNRATGVVCLVLLTLVLVLGILVRRSQPVGVAPRFVVAAVHRNASLLTLVFLGIHIATAVLDPYVTLNVADAVVPFGAGYRLLWVGLGALCLDLMLAVIITSLLRERIGVRAWRLVHWLTYATWPIALAHGLGTGSDIGAWWMITITALCTFAVLGSVGWRIQAALARPSNPPLVRLPAPIRQETLR